ncbi:sugar ABC transporter substrate-binding protein [Solirubrobacter phytolaccae]|uniref:Sugar ABC transporter substrate-binding protein n=1 Tax=Solirubrobacter phytolaccae TaxID=1404360 RepID=A0A9X3NMW0_9ACTN|nr:sugar ABC transporter substrate-binding protein [Solirubrobacter phytolaccae]MDA0184362.1 sugar ABC transporter substrate-binding protein [Solirubrobacter phytolaccae]
MGATRWVAAALAAALVAGCGDDGGGEAEPTTTAAAAATEEAKPVRVAVIMASLGNDFYIAQKAGVEEEAAKLPGAEVEVSAGRAQGSTDDVVGLIENAITKQVDAIAVNGSDTKPLLPALRKVLDADIPLVLFDAPADELTDQLAAYIGTDNQAGGEAGGAWLKEQLPEGGKVGVVLCVAGHPVTTARYEGFKAGAGTGFDFVADADAGCDPEKGRKAMEDMITRHSDLDAVFSTSDSQSVGMIKALEAANQDPLFVSFDAQPAIVKDIQAGTVIDASVAWSAREIGADAVKAAVAAARDEAVEAKTLVPVTVVSADNAADWKG